jgi:hypothetical protein
MNALHAEGVPVSVGYDRPLYANPLFRQRNTGDADSCPISCPFYGRDIDYTTISCPVCEQVVTDTLWIFHTVLLAPESDIHLLIGAVEKVMINIGELRA